MSSNKNLALVRGEPLEVYPSTYHHLEKGLNRNPDGPAISAPQVVMHQPRDHLSGLTRPRSQDEPGSGCLVWTHTQFRHAAIRVAQALIASGIQRGSTVVTLIPNRVEWALLRYASLLCGATFAPLDFGTLSQPRAVELRNFMTRLKPDAIVVTDREGAGSVDSALGGAGQPLPKVRVALDEQHSSYHEGWTSLLDLVSNAGKPTIGESELLERARARDPDRIDMIVFTSGTSSGKPKGCPRHEAGNAFSIEGHKETAQLNEHSRYLLASANFRIIAPALAAMVWSKGGAIVMPSPSFDPKAIMKAIQEHGITYLVFVPFQLHALTKDPSFSPDKTSSVECAMFGGDMITKDLLRKGKQSFPTARVSASHGMTESGGVFSWPYSAFEIHDIPDFEGISTLGVVSPGSALRIYDIENDRIANRGERGEFQISSPTIIKHYLEDENQGVFIEEEKNRWFKTGDVGFINDKGEVFLLGRMNDRIKRAGIRIEPVALETSISAFIGSQVSVFGIPHAELGQEPYVVVESFNDKTANKVKQHVVDVFGDVSALGGACTLAQLGMSQFPLNATGKVMKMTLRDAVLKYIQQ